MKNRIPTYPGRVTLNPVEGQPDQYDLVRADDPIEIGTPLNKETLLSDTAVSKLWPNPPADPTVSDAFIQMRESMFQVGDILTSVRDKDNLGESWLECDGSQIPAETYPELANLLQTGAVDDSPFEPPKTHTTNSSSLTYAFKYLNGFWCIVKAPSIIAGDNILTVTYSTDITRDWVDWNMVTLNAPPNIGSFTIYDLFYEDSTFIIAGTFTTGDYNNGTGKINLTLWTTSALDSPWSMNSAAYDLYGSVNTGWSENYVYGCNVIENRVVFTGNYGKRNSNSYNWNGQLWYVNIGDYSNFHVQRNTPIGSSNYPSPWYQYMQYNIIYSNALKLYCTVGCKYSSTGEYIPALSMTSNDFSSTNWKEHALPTDISGINLEKVIYQNGYFIANGTANGNIGIIAYTHDPSLTEWTLKQYPSTIIDQIYTDDEYIFAVVHSPTRPYNLTLWSTNDISEANISWKSQSILSNGQVQNTNSFIAIGNGYLCVISTNNYVEYIYYKRINVTPILPKISLSGDTVTWIKAKNL